jgi:hypothetical protein
MLILKSIIIYDYKNVNGNKCMISNFIDNVFIFIELLKFLFQFFIIDL